MYAEVLDMSLGERIRLLRTGRNLSQNDLAEALSVSRQSISKWETDGAVPELDKLVGMSELFGVSLDALIKGSDPAPPSAADAASTPTPAVAEKQAPHRTAGVILLCFGALIATLLLVLGGGLAAPIFAFPFLLCGIICLCTRLRTGLWCGWAAYLCVDLYLRYATGITWALVFLTPQFTPEMNYVRLAVGWAQCLAGILLIALTLWSYRKKTAACDRKHLVLAAINLLLLVGLTLAQSGIVRHLLSQPDFASARNQHLVLLAAACGDILRLFALVVLLVLGAALLRQWRRDRNASHAA